jgi:hypothetical protein
LPSRGRSLLARAAGALGALLAAASPAGAACTAGARTLLVPEDCATVAAAVAAAGDGATIDVAAGVAPLGGAPLVLSNLGRALTLRARSAGATTFSGGGASPIVVVENASAGSGRPIAFEGIRFAGGSSSTGNRAGGVTLSRAEASFVDCEFEDNEQTHASTGGGALVLVAGSRALVARSRFEGNRARNNGGAIYAVRGAGSPPVSLWLHDSELIGNSTAGAGFTSTSAGGAIYARDAAVRIADSRFEANLAGRAGGAVYAFGSWGTAPECDFTAPSADLVVARSHLLDNRADDAAGEATVVGPTVGGAMHLEGCVRLRLSTSLLEENESEKGGAISAEHARVDAEQSVFRHNRALLAAEGAAPVGGALAAFTSEAGRPLGPIALSRLVFAGGRAGDASAANAHYGGCLSIAGDASARRTASVVDTIFSGCNAELVAASEPNVRGGGLRATRASLTLTRALFVDNSALGVPGKLGRGGGAAILSDSVATWTDAVFAGNDADGVELDLVVTADSTSSGSIETWSEAPDPPAGVLLAAPSRPAGPGAPFIGEAHLGHAWRGAGAELDGEPLAATEGLAEGTEGAHALEVEGLGSCGRCAATILAPIEPETTLDASPEEIAGGGSSTLEWTTPEGELLAALVDRGVGETGASGSVAVSPAGSASYRRLAITKQGGALAETRVWVDELAPDPIFTDGFEGGLAAWDEVVP